MDSRILYLELGYLVLFDEHKHARIHMRSVQTEN